MGVNPKCIDDYVVLEWKNLTKLHIFAAKHKVNTYSEKLFSSDDCGSVWSWPPVKLWRHVKPKNSRVYNTRILITSSYIFIIYLKNKELSQIHVPGKCGSFKEPCYAQENLRINVFLLHYSAIAWKILDSFMPELCKLDMINFVKFVFELLNHNNRYMFVYHRAA